MRISHATERTRRALWVMYTRLTSTRLHKFYTLTLLITLLPLIILHLLALSNTTTALNKLSVIISTTNSTNGANSVVPTVTDQNGQGILQLCNVGQSDCQTVTSVAPTETETPTSTSTSTPQQVQSPVNTVPVNAGVVPTSSTIPVPEVAVQPGGARPASPASPASSPSSSQAPNSPINSAPPPPPPPPPQESDGGVLIATPPAQTQTQTQPSSSTSSTSSSSTSPAVFIADAPSTTSTTSTASTSKKSSAGNGGGGSDDNKGTSTETGTTTDGSTTTSSAEKEIATETDSSVVSSSSSESTTIAAAKKESSTATDSSTTAPSTSTTSTSSIATESPSPTETSSRSKETDSGSKETESASAPVVGKDVSINDVTLSSTTTTHVLPALLRPEFESSTVLSSSVLFTSVSSTSSTTSPASSSPSSSVDAAKDEAKDTQEGVTTAKDAQESSSTSQTTESSTSTPTSTPTSTSSTSKSQSQSDSESIEIKDGQGQATSTNVNGDIQRRSPSTSNIHFFSRHLSPRAFSATPITNSTTGALDGIDVTDVDDTGGSEVTRLGVVCAIAMAFPRDQLRQEWMENLTMAAFYLGMLGVGIAAIFNESVAHLITISLSTLLSLLWTGTQLVRTHYLHDQFDAFITRGACSGIDVLPSYWAQRTRLELPILIINALALLLLGILGVQLLKRYHREGGGGRGVERYVYKVVIILRCAVLLGGFLLVASMGIWVHLLLTNAGVVGASGVDLLKALGIVSLMFVAPWAVLGWLALNAATPSTSGSGAYNGGINSRNGKWGRWWGKRTMIGFFCGLNVLFLGGWVATFASDVYRAVFLAWTFFAVLSIAGFFVLMGSLGAGVVCWMRFARDLQDFDSEKPPRDMTRIASIDSFGIVTSIDPFGVRPSNPSHSHSGHSHSHVHGGVGVGLSVPESLRWDYSNTAEKAWEPFDKASIRQSQFTASEGRQSTVFSYGLRSPAPPMPARPEYGSSNNSNVSLGLAL